MEVVGEAVVAQEADKAVDGRARQAQQRKLGHERAVVHRQKPPQAVDGGGVRCRPAGRQRARAQRVRAPAHGLRHSVATRQDCHRLAFFHSTQQETAGDAAHSRARQGRAQADKGEGRRGREKAEGGGC